MKTHLPALALILLISGLGVSLTTARAALPSRELHLDIEPSDHLDSASRNSRHRVVEQITQASALRYRRDLFARLKAAGVPAVARVHPDGSMIPVVLLSKETAANPAVRKILAETMGMGIDISQGKSGGNDVDHGLARLGDRLLVDIIYQGGGMHQDPAGQTVYGSNELNYTAIRYRDMLQYMGQRKPGSRVQIELAYLATSADQQTALIYHNMRRAGLISIVIESVLRWEKNWNAEWLDDGIKAQPRLFADGCSTVNCFTNYMGSRIPSHIDTMKTKLRALGIDPDTMLRHSGTRRFLESAARQLVQADWKDPAALNPRMLDRADYRRQLSETPGFNALEPERQLDVMSYLVAIDASQNYARLMHEQGADAYAGRDADAWDHWPRQFADKKLEMDSENPRAVAAFIYSDDTDAAERLREGSLAYEGAIWGVWKNGESPHGNRVISLDEALAR